MGDAMTSRKNNSSRKLSFQTLEDRQLMAANITAGLGSHLTSNATFPTLSGNVTAAVVNNGLTITGDDFTDIISITQVAGTTNKFTVAGLSTSGGDTTVNGETQQTFTVKGNISVNFKNGLSILLVGDATSSAYTTLPGSLNVVYGATTGNNFLMNKTTVSGNLHVSSGSGIDFEIHNSVVGTSAVNGGSNDCYLSSKGSDFILLDHTSVKRDLLIYDGSATSDQIFLTGDHVGRNATIQTGAGIDKVNIDETYFVGKLNIQTGGGNDTVVLGEHVDPSGNQPRNKSAEYSVHADSIFTDLGAGDDQLFVNNLYGSTNFNGGDGNDSMLHDDRINLGSYSGTTGFESIDGVAPAPVHHHVAVKAKV
jgi:hypothetical protein